MTGARREAPRRFDGAIVGAGVVLGWVAVDLAFLLVGRAPSLALGLLPGSAAAVLLGAVLGALAAWQRLVHAGLLVTAAAGALLARTGQLESLLEYWRLDPVLGGLPWAALLLLLGGTLVGALSRRGRLRPAAAAVAVGALLSAASAVRSSVDPQLQALVLGAGALAVLAASLRRPVLRAAALGVLLAVPALHVASEARDALRLPRPDRPSLPSEARRDAPNLLLITLDTVRCDRLASYGYERVTTPGLDAFAARHAVRYSEARSTSPWTLPAHGSLFTGLLPSEHGATLPRQQGDERVVRGELWPAERLRRDVPVLAEALSGRGYRTGAIVANSAYLSHAFGLDRGFEHYDDRPGAAGGRRDALAQRLGWHPTLGVAPYRSAGVITDLAIRWLEDASVARPFFLFLNYMEAHTPYAPPAPFDRAFASRRPRDPSRPLRRMFPLLYDRELLHLDHHLTRLLDWLERTRTLHDTVVIVTSDHGEAFGEHGHWQHGGYLYEELVCIPLFVKPAGPRALPVETRPIQLAQVYHLALAELGIEAGAPAAEAGVFAEFYGFSERKRRAGDFPLGLRQDLLAWKDGSLKTIVSSRGDVERYDLASDPGERKRLAVSGPEAAQARAIARRWWEARPPVGDRERPPPDPDVLEQLRELGYVE